jgi:hypothetical protein
VPREERAVSVDYNSWSLKQLKDAIESSNLNWVQSASRYFDQGAKACSHAADDFMAQVGALGAAWQGAAASAAAQDATATHQVMAQTTSASTSSSSSSQDYYHQASADQARSRSIPNVDNSWGHAVTSGGWGGLVGIGGAKLIQQHKYDQAHSQAVQLAQKMDSEGQSHASTMRSQSWPSGAASYSEPPSTLPPVPGASGRSGSVGGNYNVAPSGPRGGGGYSTSVGGTRMSQQDTEIMTHGVKGSGPNHTVPNDYGYTPHTPNTNQPNIPSTTSQGIDTGPLTPGTTPTQALPPTPGPSGGAGAVTGLLGGAGLLGAGALGGRAALADGSRYGMPGEGESLGRGRAGGLAEGERAGLRSGSGSGLAEGERGGPGSGFAEGEGGRLRPGARGLGAPPEENLGAERSMLRGGAPEGFMGEPVAGEAGRMGGYPGGGRGAGRRDEEEEAPVPDYLVETEDVWGDGVTAAPPVIGE